MTGYSDRLARADTFPKLLRLNACEHPADTAYREKKFGIWRAFTWTDYQTRVRNFALGLFDLGLERGDVVALIGDNRPDWIVGEIASHAVGAISLGLYRDALDEEVAHLLRAGDVTIALAENEEQIDKLLSIANHAPRLRRIVYSDPRGIRKYSDPRLISADELARRGRDRATREPNLYDLLVDATRGEEVAILCTTSGTTSHPKLAMLSAARLLRHCAAYLTFDPKGPDDEYVSVLPLPWIMEQVYALGKALLCRMKVNFVEEPETMMQDLREIAPTFVLFAPRLWEAVAADVHAKMMDASPLKRCLYHFGMKVGLAALAEERRSTIAETLLFRALRDRLGFTRLRSAATGGAALGPETFRFFRALGVPLRQLYGQTELVGAYTLHRSDDVDFDSVGVGFDAGIEMRIEAPNADGIGEIVTHHPNMFLGYYKDQDATDSDLRGGWMHTGDAGYFNAAGHLIVIDRIRDLATTARGTRFSPQYVENKLKFSPYVAEAVILGSGHDYLAAIICIRFSIVSRWAEKNRISFTTYTDLASRPEVYDLIRREVETVNATLLPGQRIAKFLLLFRELDADDGELTRTRKVRRGVIAERYSDIIAAIYAGRSAIDVDTIIRFQDGTTQRLQTTLTVVTLDVPQASPALMAAE